MPRNQSLKHILAQAEEKERRFDWFSAIEFYNTAKKSVMEEKHFPKAGNIQEKIGFCFRRAAMQAKTKGEFREKIGRALEAYENARKFYGKPQRGPSEPRRLRCDAAAKYLSHWLTSDPSEKKRLLEDCLDLERKTLSSFLETGENLEYVRTFNEFSLVFFYRVFLEENRQTLKSVLEKVVEWGEKAVAQLPKLDKSLAGTYLTLAACLSDAGYYLISESEKIDEYRLKAIEYLNNAVELSEETGDAFLLGMAHLWLGINKGEEAATRHHEKALEYGRLTGDNFLTANALDYLAYDTYWKARSRAIEDPEARRKLAKKAMEFYENAQSHFNTISFISPRGGLIGPPSGQAEHFYHLAMWELDPQEKQKLLEKSEQLGMDALKLAEDSGMPLVIAQVLHVVSKILQAQARLEPNSRSRKTRLEKALAHRERTIAIFSELTPFFYWNLGVMMHYLAGIKGELADVEPDAASKTRLFQEAVSSLSVCLELCRKVMPDLEKKGEVTLFAPLRDYQETYAALLMRLYKLTNKVEYLKKAIKALRETIISAEKLDMVSLKAESYWKIAKAQDLLGEHLEAAESFDQASKSYLGAAEKIPRLNDFYREHASYMQAWNEIQKAKYSHIHKQYGEAKKHYENVASLHKSTQRWSYLTSNYLAWARLEEAEEFSRDERIQEATILFEKAAKLFREAKNTLQKLIESIESENEKDLVKRLIKALDIRQEYCQGRIALEEAKILGRHGDNSASSNKYGLAARRFQRTLENIESESNFTNATITKDRQELTPIIYLSKAWQMMKKAEAEASPELYLESSKLFEQAKEYSFDERTRLLALGHSRFCMALEIGARFEESRDTKLYLKATQHLESAANYYVRAGFKMASEYAAATQRLFDAYIYMANAKKETDPEKRARYYIVAEKVLQTSIGAYLQAKHPAKSRQVQRLLEKVREERELATSLSEVLNAPTITSSTASFVTPTPSEETAVGLERFEHASIQASLTIPTKKASVGESLSLQMQISNVGKQAVLLDRIKGLIPLGFELTSKPSYSVAEAMDLNMKGKRIDPLKTEDVVLELKPFKSGDFEVRPRITYLDESGQQAFSELGPAAVKVSKIVLKNRITTGYADVDDLLLGGIPEKYAIVLTSPSCDERDLLIKRFLEAGAKKGQTVFYVTMMPMGLEKLAQDFRANFYLFICNPQADKAVKEFDNVFRFKGVENLTDINIALTSVLRKLKSPPDSPRRCCIQIISDVLLQHHAMQSRRWLNSLLPELRTNGFTVLAVFDPRMHSQQEASAVLDLFDGEINVYEERNVRLLRVKRLAKKKFLEGELPLNTRF